MSYPCSKCSYLFYTPTDLNNHFQKKHEIETILKKFEAFHSRNFDPAYLKRKISQWEDRLVHAKEKVRELEEKIQKANQYLLKNKIET